MKTLIAISRIEFDNYFKLRKKVKWHHTLMIIIKQANRWPLKTWCFLNWTHKPLQVPSSSLCETCCHLSSHCLLLLNIRFPYCIAYKLSSFIFSMYNPIFLSLIQKLNSKHRGIVFFNVICLMMSPHTSYLQVLQVQYLPYYGTNVYINVITHI